MGQLAQSLLLLLHPWMAYAQQDKRGQAYIWRVDKQSLYQALYYLPNFETSQERR